MGHTLLLFPAIFMVDLANQLQLLSAESRQELPIFLNVELPVPPQKLKLKMKDIGHLCSNLTPADMETEDERRQGCFLPKDRDSPQSRQVFRN